MTIRGRLKRLEAIAQSERLQELHIMSLQEIGGRQLRYRSLEEINTRIAELQGVVAPELGCPEKRCGA